MSRRLNDGAGHQRALTAPLPARTETYSPVPHAFFIDSLRDEINNAGGLEVTGQRVYSSINGQKVVGFTSVKHRGMETDPEFGLEMMIGWQNSYDKSMAGALAAGVQVMVCSNGCIAGDMVAFKRKHTGTVQEELAEKAREAITKMKEGFGNLVLEIDIMKDFQLTDKQKAELMGVMYFEENMVTPNQLSVIKKEIKESDHFKGNTLWDLYNNVTESFKSSHPLRHIDDHMRLHQFMTGVAGILPHEIGEGVIDTGGADTGFGIEAMENVDGPSSSIAEHEVVASGSTEG
jgi:hypothetical protein